MPHTKNQEGGAVSNAVAELASAKLSNNNYYTCTHIVQVCWRHILRHCQVDAHWVLYGRIILSQVGTGGPVNSHQLKPKYEKNGETIYMPIHTLFRLNRREDDVVCQSLYTHMNV